MSALTRLVEGKVAILVRLSRMAFRPASVNPYVILLLSDKGHCHDQVMKVIRRGPRPNRLVLTIQRDKTTGNQDFPVPVRLELEYNPPGEMIIDLTCSWSGEGLRQFLEVTRQENCFAICFGYISQGQQGGQALHFRPWVIMGRPEDIIDQEANQSA